MNCAHAGCDRTFNLLSLPEPYCHRHIPPPHQTTIVDLDRRGPAIGISRGAWPYGPNIDIPSRQAMVEWAEHERLRYSPNGRCLHWIARGRCAVRFCTADANRHPWMDHVTGWTRDGKPAVLVCQPYPIFDVIDVANAGDAHGLQVRIADGGWYGSGAAWVALWSPSAAGVKVRGDFWSGTTTSVLRDLAQDSDVWMRGKSPAESEAFTSSLSLELARREGLCEVVPLRWSDDARQR